MRHVTSLHAFKKTKSVTVTVEDLSWLLHFVKKNKRVHFRASREIMAIEKRFIKQLYNTTVDEADVDYLRHIADTYPDKIKKELR